MKTVLQHRLFLWALLPLLAVPMGFAQTVPSRSVQMRGVISDSRPRIAVLIGNQNYQVRPLGRPLQDVEVLRKALKNSGFNQIRVFTDVKTNFEFENRVNEALKSLLAANPGAVVVLYYSGHAIQVKGVNYLVPTQATQFGDLNAATSGSYQLMHLIETLSEGGAELQLVFLDACRNNPYLDRVRGLKKDIGTTGLAPQLLPRPRKGARSAARGLKQFARVEPGALADDDGKFADRLAEWMQTPGAELSGMMKAIGPDLETDDSQPWEEGYISGDFYFQPPVYSWEPSRLEQLGGSWIPQAGGRLMRGSTTGESDEVPVKAVSVPAFDISRTEVTVAQYRACVEAKWEGCTKPDDRIKYCNWGIPARDNHPINCLDWQQARAFAAWVGGRLPTEAEWEFAARGTAGRTYPWGNGPEPSCDLAIMNTTGGVTDWDKMGCGMGGTSPVCSKLSGNTPEGLCDMGGNVFEWIEDCYHKDYLGAPENGSARTSACSMPSFRVARGGGWNEIGSGLRAASRISVDVGLRFYIIGFRVVRSVSRAGVP